MAGEKSKAHALGSVILAVDENGHAQPLAIDSVTRALLMGTTIDFIADIEVGGIPVTPDCGDITTAMTTTVEAVGAGDRAKVYAVSLSSTDGADLAGTVTVKIGSVQIAPKVAAIKGGGAHWVLPRDGNYIHGALGDDITIVTDTAENLSYAVYHEVYTP
jgi:hypothetical protein